MVNDEEEWDGFFDDHTDILLEDMRKGLHATQTKIAAEHSFEENLAAFDALLMHLQMSYEDHGIHDTLFEMAEIVSEIGVYVHELEKGEIHFSAETEAAKKLGKNWILHHKKQIEGEKEKIEVLEKKTATKLHEFFQQLKALVEKLSLEEDDELHETILQVKHFILTYEQEFAKLT